MVFYPPMAPWIQRSAVESRIRPALLSGPGQVGSPPLARSFLPGASVRYFDLESPRDLQRLEEPLTALQALPGLVVIDEIQRRPDLFAVLRVLIDRDRRPGQFLILGSAS